jgi:hypothetical protein
MKILSAFVLCLFTINSFACSVPKAGSGYPLERLIDESKNILMVQMVDVDKNDFTSSYTLKVVEVLKGVAPNKITFFGYSEKYDNNDFDSHKNLEFWANDNIGRSEWPCCICGPDHSFEKGVNYLYFPDLLGAIKSAEIVNTKEDKWYKFVKKRLGK